MMNSQSVRDAALEYAARGWAVFPVKAGTKQPRTAHGFKDATRDPAKIKEWYSRYSEKKKAAKRLGEYSIAIANYQRIGSRSSGKKSPTEVAAIRNVAKAERALKDCRIIEEAAMWAANVGGYEEAWRPILRNVTKGTGYDMLVGLYDIPFCVADFYGLRRAFFYRLDGLQHYEAEDEKIERPGEGDKG